MVDLDVEKFFDRVNHDMLMARLARRIGDKRLLRIVRRFLEAGLMREGVCLARHEGTPQGGPLSPLLANLLLDDLDKELERRGHRFCRYADDCNIYVRSQAAGERVMASVTAFLEGKLKLRVNRQKSAVAPVGERQFLGHRLNAYGGSGIAPKSLKRAKDRLRRITRRNRARQDDHGGEFLHHRLGDVLPLRPVQDGTGKARRMASSQAALRPPQALQARQNHRRFPARKRRSGMACLAIGLVGKRMVAHGGQPTGCRSHDHRMVQGTWPGQPRPSSRRACRCRKPPWYVVVCRVV